MKAAALLIAMTVNFVLSVSLFLGSSAISAFIKHLYFDKEWRFLDSLVMTRDQDTLEIVYLPIAFGVGSGVVTYIARRFSPVPKFYLLCASAPLLGAATYWLFNPDRTSGTWGGGSFFTLKVLFRTGFLFISFLASTVASWMAFKICKSLKAGRSNG